MGKKQKRCTKKCLNHNFLLKPVAYYAHLSRQLSACFCFSTAKNISIMPTFNKDNCNFTAGFTLPIDEKKTKKQQQVYKQGQDKLKKENESQNQEIQVPKPRSKNNYCNVCKDEFQDYLDHIKSKYHKKNIRNSRFQPFIEELCECMKIRQTNNVLEDQNLHNLFENEEQVLSLRTYQLFNRQQNVLFRTSTSLIEGGQKSIGFKSFNKIINPISDQIELQRIELINEEPENKQIGIPISPIKKHSQITEGSRIPLNVRPIVILASTFSQL